MKRLGFAVAVALALGASNAGGHPGHGAEAVTIDGDALRYTPATVTVGVGDAVVWFWGGSVSRNHSVTSDPGQAEQFDSDPDAPPGNDTHPAGTGFSHVFTHPGRFTYYCQNHASMRGAVEVVAPPDPAPGAPRLSALRVTIDDNRLLARFRLSERADLVARVAKRSEHRWRTKETFYRRAGAGENRAQLPALDLGAGRYRLSLTAYDQTNARSNVASARFVL